MDNHIFVILRRLWTQNWLVLFVALVIMTGLFMLSMFSYVWFHTLAMGFSIFIAFTIFAMTWNSRGLLNNGYLLFLGISFLFVGMMDLLYTLAFPGMKAFPGTAYDQPNKANLATQFWLSARYTQSLAVAIAPLFLLHDLKNIRPGIILAGYCLMTALLCLSIVWGLFPSAYLDGTGPTPFKIISEYVFIFFYFLGTLILLRIRSAFDTNVLRLLIASIIFNGISEFAFSEYLNPSDYASLVGYFLKIISFYLIFKAIIETGFKNPRALLFPK